MPTSTRELCQATGAYATEEVSLFVSAVLCLHCLWLSDAAFRYYQALKVLEELEHTHLALVEKYRFTQILAKTMAPVRNEIKAKVFGLHGFLAPFINVEIR